MTRGFTRRGAIGAAGTSAAALAIGGSGCLGSSRGERLNVLLVIVDSVRSDFVAAYGARRVGTPHIDSLAADGLRFTRFFPEASRRWRGHWWRRRPGRSSGTMPAARIGSAMSEPLQTETEFAALAERHRHELRVHCYRMLGSFDEAEDAVQETLMRAWRARETLERAEHLRAWPYKIATNTCLDAIKRRGRQLERYDSIADIGWLQPYPDELLDLVAAPEGEPGDALVERETIELTFLAVIQLLPPAQRATLILREVLGWSAKETAELLELSVPAVNSALQRARATLREHLPAEGRELWTLHEASESERRALQGFIDAHERGDSEAALELIADDVRVTMPPDGLLFDGRAAVAPLIERASSGADGDWRLVPTAANRQPAAASYLRAPGGDAFRAFKVDVLRVVDGKVAEVTTFGSSRFDAFGLPATLPD